MARRSGLLGCALALTAGLADRGPMSGVATGQPAADRGPAAIVVRSVRPPDDKDPAAPRSFAPRYGLTQKDYDTCRKLDSVKHAVPVRFTPAEVRHENRLCAARVVATTEGYAGVRPVELAAGRFLKDREDALANVVVLGAGVARELFPDGEPVGGAVLLRSVKFVVVGVLKANPRAGSDHDVFIPTATSRARFGEVVFYRWAGARSAERVDLHEIIVTPTDPARLTPLADAIRGVLEKHHEARDWEVVPPLPRPREAK